MIAIYIIAIRNLMVIIDGMTTITQFSWCLCFLKLNFSLWPVVLNDWRFFNLCPYWSGPTRTYENIWESKQSFTKVHICTIEICGFLEDFQQFCFYHFVFWMLTEFLLKAVFSYVYCTSIQPGKKRKKKEMKQRLEIFNQI